MRALCVRLFIVSVGISGMSTTANGEGISFFGSPPLLWMHVGQTFLSAGSPRDFMADRNVRPRGLRPSPTSMPIAKMIRRSE
jgi:hypothetical protein